MTWKRTKTFYTWNLLKGDGLDHATMDQDLPVCYQYIIFNAIVKTILLSSNPMKSLQYIVILLLFVKYILCFKNIYDNVSLDIFLM